MAKQKKVTGRRVEYWKNKKGEINFRIYSANGRMISGSINQGFKRLAAVVKSLESLAKFFCIDENYHSSYPLIKVNGPGRKHRGKRAA